MLAFAYFIANVWLVGALKALVYTTIPISYLGVGQLYIKEVVPPTAIDGTLYFSGRSLHYIFSPDTVLTLISWVVLPLYFWKERLRLAVTVEHALLFLLFLLGLFSSLWFAQNPWMSTFFTLEDTRYIVWLYLLLVVVRTSPKTKLYRILTTVLCIICLLVWVESMVVFLQVAFRSVLGLIVERQQSNSFFGFGADESKLLFRPLGFQSHANALANSQLSLLTAIVVITHVVSKSRIRWIRKIVPATVLLGVCTIFLTASRSALIALGLCALILCLIYRARIKKYLSRNYTVSLLGSLVIGVLLLIFTFQFSSRIWFSLFSLTDTGGASVRWKQMGEAAQIIEHNPWFGVGKGMYIPTTYRLFPQGVVRSFPENVHNGFMLYVVEVGLLGAVGVGWYYVRLFSKLTKQSSPVAKLLGVCAILASFTIMMFHPFINFFSMGSLLVLLLL